MLELILKRLRPIAEKQNIELVLETFRPVTAEIDEVKLTLAITNLVENAIKYNRENGWVHVTLNADYQYFYVKVEDSGIGNPGGFLRAYLREILPSGQVPFEGDRWNRTWTCDYKKCRADAPWSY